ncbi:hypothetical protein QCA50_019970 [Cerrena zonata]|uniref:Uncharacterized protein n=1 Tax=Cerrena zonata TaxID=2478898 RepID=A0AAW0FD70_9APHY
MHFDVLSASSVEEPSSSPNPSGNYHISPGHTPTRSSSYDDVVCMSGSGTMTPTPSVAFVHWSSSYHTFTLSTYCTRNIVTPSSSISPIH